MQVAGNVVYEVPPDEIPKRLTASCRPHTLREHLLGFLCTNNPSGFLGEIVDGLSPETVGDLLLLVANEDVLTEKRLKCFAKKLTRQSSRSIKHCQALELLSALFGYANYDEARLELEKSGRLANRRNRATINMKVFAIPGADNRMPDRR